MGKDIKILLGVTLGTVAVIVALVTFSNPQGQEVVSDSSRLVRADSYGTGNQSAKVILVEFGDFQCPACAAAEPVIKEIIAAYGKNPNFNLVFRHFPLQQHKNAMISSEAAEAAGAQGKFWEMYGLLYENQSEWSDSNKPLDIFVGYAEKLGLDVNKFKQEVQSEKYKDKINADQRDGVAIGVNSTPTFYLNGVKTVGVPVFNGLKAKIDAELSK